MMGRMFVLCLVGLFAIIKVFANEETTKNDESQVLVVVNKDNRIKSMTREQLVDLFMGKYVQFPDGQAAIPVDLEEATETKRLFYEKLVGLSLARVNAYWSRIRFTGKTRPPRREVSEQSVVQFIEQEPLAIGYVSKAFINSNLKVVYEFDQ